MGTLQSVGVTTMSSAITSVVQNPPTLSNGLRAGIWNWSWRALAEGRRGWLRQLEIGLRRCAWRSAATAALQQRKLSTAALETTDPEPNRPIVGLKTVEALLDREVLHANEELTARHVGRGRAPNEQ